MKIGHFASFGLGGADRNALNIVAKLKSEGLDVTVYYNTFSEPKVMPAHSKGYTPISRKAQFEEVCDVVKINSYQDLHKANLDLLHTHRSGEDTWLIPGFDVAAHPFKIIETNFHGNRLTKADVRAYPNETLCKTKNITLNESNIIVPNAIDLPKSTENMRQELGVEGKVVFGRIARPDSDIYNSVNLEAYAGLETDQTVFVYVAPHENARRDAVKLGIRNIIWVDPTTDAMLLSKLYNTFDIFLHCNAVGETFGNTIAEAMIHGVPVVSHTGTSSWPQAHKELFAQHDEFIVSGPDVAAYREKAKALLSSVELRREIGDSLQKSAIDRYSSLSVAKKYLFTYEEILRGKR